MKPSHAHELDQCVQGADGITACIACCAMHALGMTCMCT